MTRLRESIEKAATAPLTEDERQELQPPSMGERCQSVVLR